MKYSDLYRKEKTVGFVKVMSGIKFLTASVIVTKISVTLLGISSAMSFNIIMRYEVQVNTCRTFVRFYCLKITMLCNKKEIKTNIGPHFLC